jgi:hypothetical protein
MARSTSAASCAVGLRGVMGLRGPVRVFRGTDPTTKGGPVVSNAGGWMPPSSVARNPRQARARVRPISRPCLVVGSAGRNRRRSAKSQADGGEGGIRTPDGLPRTAFPVRRHRPLGDLSAKPGSRLAPRQVCHVNVRRCRSGGEGGIRTHGAHRTPLFESGTLNHSDTSPRGSLAPGPMEWQ